MRRKLHSRKGESLAEVLAATLVIILGLTILAMAIAGGLRVSRELKKVQASRAEPDSETEVIDSIDDLDNIVIEDIDSMSVTIAYKTGDTITASYTGSRSGGRTGSLYYYD